MSSIITLKYVNSLINDCARSINLSDEPKDKQNVQYPDGWIYVIFSALGVQAFIFMLKYMAAVLLDDRLSFQLG